MNGIRVKSVARQRSFLERLRIWFWDVIWEIEDFPSRETYDFIEVNPGEEGYDESHWEFGYDINPMTFEVKDGVATKK